MADRDRQTSWRQGHILTDDVAVGLNVILPKDKNEALAMVISHDCDIIQEIDIEPFVEIIVGHRIATSNGNYTHAKNPRRLHLSAREKDSSIVFELAAISKKIVQKEKLFNYQPNPAFTLSSKELLVLQRWLAARYHRSAYPDEFQRCLQDTGLIKRLAKILESLGDYLIAVFFDIDETICLNQKRNDDPYGLRIILLYSTEMDPQEAEQTAKNATALVVKAFRENYFDSEKNVWKKIELLECVCVADEAMTYAMSLQLKKWNFDYVSLRKEPSQPLLLE